MSESHPMHAQAIPLLVLTLASTALACASGGAALPGVQPAETAKVDARLEDDHADYKTVDWPHWRGANRDGVSPERSWLSQGASEALWTAQVGLGYSSPSIQAGRLFTRGYFPGEGEGSEGIDATQCIDSETGEIIWSRETPAKIWDNMHGGGTLTTPTLDGDAVYVLSRFGGLEALDAGDGSVRWERKLDTELEVGLGPFGFCSSPVVDGDVLYVNVGKTVALDKRTGETKWETRDYGPSYATPEMFTAGDKALLAVFNAEGLAVLDRKSGTQVALHPWTSQYNVNSASPIVVDGKIFISTGYNDIGCAMLELKGDKLEPAWTNKSMNNYMNGCVLVDGRLYGFDRKLLRCMDLSGEVLWTERGLGRGTVIASDGRLIVLSEEGELLVAPASADGFEPVSRERVIEEGACWSTPVLSGGRIYCRSSAGVLVCRDHRP